MPYCFNSLRQFLFSKYVVFLAITFVLFGLFQPLAITSYGPLVFLYPFYEWNRLVAFIAVIVAFILFGKKDFYVLVLAGIFAACCFSSHFNGEAMRPNLDIWAPFFTITLLVGTVYKNHLKEFLWSLLVVTGILCALNLASMVVFPLGMYQTPTMIGYDNFFWGHRNGSYQIVLPAIVASLFLDALNGKRISVRSVVVLLLGLMVFIVKLSVTSLFAWFFFVFFAGLAWIPKVRPWVNGVTFLGGYIFLFFSVVIFRFQEILNPLFQLFGRNATLTDRVIIWDYVIERTSDPGHFLFGMSQQFAGGFNPGFIFTGSAHNSVLHMMLIGGFIGVILLLVLCLLGTFKTFKAKTSLTASYISVAIGSVFLIGLTENTATKLVLFLFLAIAYYCLNKPASEGESNEAEDGIEAEDDTDSPELAPGLLK